ncbi:hypothetical protein [Citrobacter sedlakii]|uniref:hypothetical protein n=1 Tax=Citrobacter sedlakii TaxID=67826 RepID=UPI00388F3B0F
MIIWRLSVSDNIIINITLVIDECNNEKEPPLFEASITDNVVVLSVFGDFNEQKIIRERVTYAFHKNKIFVVL